MEQRKLNPNDEFTAGRWADNELAALGREEEWQPDLDRGLAMLRERRRKRNGRRPSRTWLVAGAMGACLSLAATPVTRAFTKRCLSACESGTEWVRQFLTAGSTGAIPSNVHIKSANRTMAPDFTLNDSSGKPVRLSEFRGNVVLLNFWATWCTPCKVEIPMFIGFQQAYRDRKFVVLGIALDEEGWSAVRPYADLRQINYPIVIGDDRTSDLFGGLKAVPTTLVIDRQGRIAATHIGLCQKSDYEQDIEAVLNE